MGTPVMQPLSSSARRLVALRSIPNTIKHPISLQSSLSRPSFALRQHPLPRYPSVPFQRHNSSLTVPEGQPKTPESGDDVPSYHLSFTCKPCLHRPRHLPFLQIPPRHSRSLEGIFGQGQDIGRHSPREGGRRPRFHKTAKEGKTGYSTRFFDWQ